MSIEHVFSAQLVDHTGEGTLTDGSILWEIVTPEGERIASCTDPKAAEALEMTLNLALIDWAEQNKFDRTVDTQS